MSQIEQLVREIEGMMRSNMTDVVLRLILSDKELTDRYLHIVADSNSLGNVHRNLGKAVKKVFHLTVQQEDGHRVVQKKPRSMALKSCSRFENGNA